MVLFKKREDIKMTPEQEQIVLGTVLGDGNLSINKKAKYSSARLRCNHGIKQAEYADWKADKMGEMVSFVKTVDNNGWGNKNRVVYTYSTPSLREIYDSVYPSGRKSVDSWVNRLGPLGLAVWYMDDGSVSGSARHIGTQAFSLKENERLKEMLMGWGASVKIRFDKRGKGYYFLEIEKPSTSEFFKVIEPHIIPSMAYKMPRAMDKERPCPVCGAVFSGDVRKVYCSKKCLKMADYERNKDAYKNRARRSREKARQERNA